MSTIGTFSYGLCAIAFGALAALILLNWQRTLFGSALLIASLITAAWAAILAWASWQPQLAALWVETAEALRTLGWLALLAVLLSPARSDNRWIGTLSVAAVIAPLGLLLLIAWQRLAVQSGMTPFGDGILTALSAGGLGFGLLGLVMLEQFYRNLPAERRWASKFLCLGVGVIFAYDVFLYANTFLFQQLDTMTWLARGAVQALAAPLIALAAARNPQWSLPVFVSRHVAFHTAAILGVAGYLLLIAAGGYFIRDFGGSWGQFLQIVLIAGAVIVLLIVIGSHDVRARLRIFLNKHFFSNKYDYREEWLRATQRLATEDDGSSPHQRAVHVVADIFGSPAGVVWLRHDDGFVPAGDWRWDLPPDAVIDAGEALPAFLERSHWVIDLAELRHNPERYNGLRLPPTLEHAKRLWAIVPLLQHGRLLGFISLARPSIDPGITWEDRDLMHALSRQVASYLTQHEHAQALSQARQFEAFNQLTAFLMHDLKNLIAQQSLLLRNAEKHKHNPEFIDDMLDTVGSSVERMERLLAHLQQRRQRGGIARVDVHQAIAEAVSRCARNRPTPRFSPSAERILVDANREELVMVLVHLIRNAQDATPEDGEVRLRTEWNGRELSLEVADSGSGMGADFIRNQLFKPFHTTKSTRGMGIGAYQVREFVHRAGGRVNVESRLGVGTRFHFTLPARTASTRESADCPASDRIDE
ncbi:PEP-CTERM system histidine kinase PrsK [Methylonatrum kenyense]|uniref:XrtA/PEP-CTERM system histidine kinase PrsK n=1 Tax=Methylonatrum kenyense TaxID=455253 RepID=UPI0020C00D07|nr:XrtA/PEP-CTERM system histidine kinase PrsK [Methylonatrum kenyense]MCK8516817.1 PEP-CTERM system histidine kinase PrsK [Methylonatrum kenyense]